MLRNNVTTYSREVGRPREHDRLTAEALVDAAERLLGTDGSGAPSLRQVAKEANTSTRAVYDLFGSKEVLLVALGNRAFQILGASLQSLPTKQDPVADLVEAGVAVFRRFALEHPSLFRIAIERHDIPKAVAERFQTSQRDALAILRQRVSRLRGDDVGDNEVVLDDTIAFHALCEGLAALELRGALPKVRAEHLWREALGALLTGRQLLVQPTRRTRVRRPMRDPRQRRERAER